MSTFTDALLFVQQAHRIFACDAPIGGGGGGGGGKIPVGEVSFNLGGLPSPGETLALALTLALFVGLAIWAFRRWSRPSRDVGGVHAPRRRSAPLLGQPALP